MPSIVMLNCLFNATFVVSCCIAGLVAWEEVDCETDIFNKPAKTTLTFCEIVKPLQGLTQVPLVHIWEVIVAPTDVFKFDVT